MVKDVQVKDNQSCGVFVQSQGSRVEVAGGSISGSKEERPPSNFASTKKKGVGEPG